MPTHTLRIDSVGGASGDMLLGALADLGADLKQVAATLRTFLPDPFEIHVEAADSHGLHGSRATVTINGVPGDHHHEPPQDEPTGHHNHSHTHAATHQKAHATSEHASPHQSHSHGHRGLTEIRAMLESAALPPSVTQRALDTFERIAVAEAEIHGTTPEKVHFHEVGATDAIVDVVGCHLAIHQLGITAVRVGPLPIGQGIMRCAHGTMPIPAPATVKILSGHNVTQTHEPHELVTPTGAALLMTLKTIASPPNNASIAASGMGFGRRTLQNRPNVLRATIMQELSGTIPETDCLLLEANIDDCSPEWLGALLPRLIDAGALDVWITPIQMKKSRPAHCLSLLCDAGHRESLEQMIFSETTTFGIRRCAVQRSTLDRHFETITTPYGHIPVKVGSRHGVAITRSPEHDACATAATAHGVSIRQVWHAALAPPDASPDASHKIPD